MMETKLWQEAKTNLLKKLKQRKQLYQNSERAAGEQDTETIKIHKSEEREPRWSLVPVIIQSQPK